MFLCNKPKLDVINQMLCHPRCMEVTIHLFLNAGALVWWHYSLQVLRFRVRMFLCIRVPVFVPLR